MALAFSQLSFPSKTHTNNNPSKLLRITPIPTLTFPKHHTKLHLTATRSSKEDDTNTSSTTSNEAATENPPAENNESVEMTELGMEIKKAMQERETKESGFFDGVAEEIREIEWPAFGKVLATTGVVIGVIAGSSVVLLTVNAVLAEISDGIFAGKGVQDFFG